MALDFNKIIMESIEETMDSADKEKDLEKKDPIQESEKKEGTESVSEGGEEENYDPAAAPAISAGLGALTLRNKIRTINTNTDNINEIDWEDIGEKVGGIAKAGLKAAKKIGGKVVDKASEAGEKITDSDIGKKVAEKASDVAEKGSDIGKKIAEKAQEIPKTPVGAATKFIATPAAAGAAGGVMAAKGVGSLAEKLRKRKEEAAAAAVA